MFSTLKTLLTAEQWQKADHATGGILLQLGNRGDEAWLESWHIRDISTEAWQRLDQLWLEASNNRFGFSIQQRIYQQVSSDLADFYKQVGWYNDKGEIRSYKDLLFALRPEIPLGHLPGIIHRGFKYPGKHSKVSWRVELGGGEYLESTTTMSFIHGDSGQKALFKHFA